MYTKIKINADSIDEIDRKLLLIAIANGKYYGGGFKAMPYASIHDSKLDISIVEKVSRFTFLSLVGKYKKGTHLDTKKGKKCITYLRTNSLTLKFDTPKKICIDGEIEIAEKVNIEVAPAAVSFIIPEGAKELERDSIIPSDTTIVNCSTLALK